jgi:hypothetical protein
MRLNGTPVPGIATLRRFLTCSNIARGRQEQGAAVKDLHQLLMRLQSSSR